MGEGTESVPASRKPPTRVAPIRRMTKEDPWLFDGLSSRFYTSAMRVVLLPQQRRRLTEIAAQRRMTREELRARSSALICKKTRLPRTSCPSRTSAVDWVQNLLPCFLNTALTSRFPNCDLLCRIRLRSRKRLPGCARRTAEGGCPHTSTPCLSLPSLPAAVARSERDILLTPAAYRFGGNSPAVS